MKVSKSVVTHTTDLWQNIIILRVGGQLPKTGSMTSIQFRELYACAVPNGKKTCVYLRPNLTSTKVDASGWPNETQVERNSKTCAELRVRLASGFIMHVLIMFYLCYVKQRCSETNLSWLILSMDVFYAPKQIVMKQKFRVNNLRKKNIQT